MKRLIIHLLKAFLKSKNKNLPAPSELIERLGNKPRILVVRQHNQLGDMLLSNSLFRAMKENLPESFICVVASKENYDAIISNKFIDCVVLFDKQKLWNPIRLIKFFHDLKNFKFDLAIVPVTVSISFTSCLIARLSKAKFTVSPKSLDGRTNKYSFMFDYAIDVGSDENDNRHISEKIQDIIKPFGIYTNDLSEHILITDETRKFAQDFFSIVKEKKVGLHIGAGKLPNRWSVFKFAEVINYLYTEYDAFVFLTIGKWDEDLLKQILPLLKKEPVVLKNFPIPKLAAIIDEADLFISNDTGIMHVAGSTKTPLIALFGPTNPEQWAPVGFNKFYIRKSTNIDDIDIEDVITLIDKIFSNQTINEGK
ncbi:MAG: glycosyltransferase family 9 protein [Ignavibacteria bacterium]